MSALPVLPKSAPFSTEEIGLLNRVMERTTVEQRNWLAGFLAGYEAATGKAVPVPAAPPKARTPLTILYATESGNSESLALKARKQAQKLGFDAKAVDMGDVDASILAKAKNIIVIAATWGEGDPPQRATDFYAGLMSDDAPKLDGTRFAVLALGDTAYVNFCQTGKLIDARLEALGGTRVADRVDCDLDFEKPAGAWTDATLKALQPEEDASHPTVVHIDFKGHGTAAEADDEPRYTAARPYEAEISTLINLNGSGSSKETWHVELALGDSGITYVPGDAIGIVAENDPDLAESVLASVGLEGNDALAQRLASEFELTTVTRPLVDAYAKLTGRADVAALLEGSAFAGFAADRQIVDLFDTYKERLTAEQLTGLLRPLPPRLYSVASSLSANPDEAHLLVGAVRWRSHGRDRKGVASTYLADRRKVGDTAKIYVKPNKHFRLPEDGSRPIVMIGAGTGIAPYRGFVEERAEAGATGKSWLFFGDRSYINDFLYQLEWQDHLRSGALGRIDVAFSRDQPEKIYIQHRLWERREELRGWLEEGAHLYVCGDEKGLGRDVHATLARILAEPHGGDDKAGEEKLSELRRAGRYQRDVY